MEGDDFENTVMTVLRKKNYKFIKTIMIYYNQLNLKNKIIKHTII